MNLLSRRSVLAIAAVVDVALHSRSTPVAAKALAARHKLPPRHLETLLQGLVHAKILKGVRGPRGGYELARDRRRITVGEIVRTAMSLSTADPEDLGANSILLERVIDPAVRRAGETFLANLDSITVEQMCETADKAHVLDDEKVAGEFAIRSRYLRAWCRRHGPFGSRRGRSQHRKPRTRTGDAGQAGDKLEGDSSFANKKHLTLLFCLPHTIGCHHSPCKASRTNIAQLTKASPPSRQMPTAKRAFEDGNTTARACRTPRAT